MPDLRPTRNRLQAAMAALAVVDVLALVVLFTPLGGSQGARQQRLAQLNQERKARATAPWRGLDKKIPQAKQQVEDFYRDRLPAEDSAISADLSRVASETGVRMTSVKYKTDDAEIEGLQKKQVDADLSGDYLQIAKFINALERDKVFFIVDAVRLGSEQGGAVKLQITVETYLRTT
jgi:type IV pilus assembly protein PilO